MLAEEYVKARKLEHHTRSFFVAHLIAATGEFKRKPDMKKILKVLNAPVDSKAEEYDIRNPEDLARYEKLYGVNLLTGKPCQRPQT